MNNHCRLLIFHSSSLAISISECHRSRNILSSVAGMIALEGEKQPLENTEKWFSMVRTIRPQNQSTCGFSKSQLGWCSLEEDHTVAKLPHYLPDHHFLKNHCWMTTEARRWTLYEPVSSAWWVRSISAGLPHFPEGVGLCQVSPKSELVQSENPSLTAELAIFRPCGHPLSSHPAYSEHLLVPHSLLYPRFSSILE